ncbi:MBL fold metallo-hydrolase [Streptomyces albus subsp. chlorinus]|uniref:MBL fold metallo-hydrolase n=1 Tax=Streptomyces albus TaxID=1888 RepID=UPI00156F3429|nr:MBL fold metallo-hydrolase [Streptomyces albus]NSC20015.1 MBL fold metallo-hydrolase [Streptomyces albus subsp. chlorinus]
MTPPPRPRSTPGPLSRRRFGQLAGLALAAGAGSLPLAPAAAAPAGGQVHYDRARRLAGDDPVLLALVKALAPGNGEVPRPRAPEPLKLFDDLALLSAGWVSAMAVLTDDGIVLIDALTSAREAEDIIVQGLRTLGADPETLAYVVVTHGHDDHYGGARYLADRYGARVMMAPADWDLVARTDPDRAPVRDLDIQDGQRLTLGGTSIRLHHTPGHTPGTVSPVFPVHAGHRRHTAMLWGGVNPPSTPAELRTYLASLDSFRDRTREAWVDVELSNHPNDYGLQRAEQLRNDPHGPNPFVLGRPRTQRYLKVMDLMLHGRLADAEAAAPTRPDTGTA